MARKPLGQIQFDEHDDTQNAKRVNVVAGGVGLATVTPLQAWPDPKTYIGLVTITGSLAAAAGNITLDPGSLTGITGNVTIDSIDANVNVINIGNITVEQGDDPWVTSNIGNVTVEQGDDPWQTAQVGNVTIDSGNVDVTSIINDSINGPEGTTGPSIDSITQFAINLVANANQVLVSSSANKQIWVYAVAYTLSVAGTVSFQDEDDTAITGIMDHAANSGLAVGPSGNFAMPIWKLATDKDLEVDIVTAAMDGWITYAIVSV